MRKEADDSCIVRRRAIPELEGAFAEPGFGRAERLDRPTRWGYGQQVPAGSPLPGLTRA